MDDRDPIARRLVGEYYMIDIPVGWRKLVENVNLQLAHISPGYEIYQIKEKFGALRIYAKYVAPGNEANQEVGEKIFDSIIHSAEIRSTHICDRCGQPGIREENDRGWIFTRCPKHKDATND